VNYLTRNDQNNEQAILSDEQCEKAHEVPSISEKILYKIFIAYTLPLIRDSNLAK